MSAVDRDWMIRKIVKYLSLQPDTQDVDPLELVTAYSAGLDDEQLKNFVRLTGIAAKYVNNLSCVRAALVHGSPELIHMITNVSDFTEDSDFMDLYSVLSLMLELGHDAESDRVRWTAHRIAYSSYEPHDQGDHWTYSRNRDLVALVDTNPEAVETILRLRRTHGYRNITQETLDDYRATHAAIIDGFL